MENGDLRQTNKEFKFILTGDWRGRLLRGTLVSVDLNMNYTHDNGVLSFMLNFLKNVCLSVCRWTLVVAN